MKRTLAQAMADPNLLGGPFQAPSFWLWHAVAKLISGEQLGEREADLFRGCAGRQDNLLRPWLVAQSLELPTRQPDDIGIDPLQGRTQLRLVEVAVVGDPAANARVVHLDQFGQRFVAAVMQRPAAYLADNITRARELLAVPAAQSETADTNCAEAAHPCPCCGGRMVIIERFERGFSPRHRPAASPIVVRIDTS